MVYNEKGLYAGRELTALPLTSVLLLDKDKLLNSYSMALFA